jgi:hypothetical protein
MASKGAAGLSTTAIEVAIHALEARDEPDRLWVEARAELAALIGRVAELTAQNAALREALAEFRVKLQEIEGVIAVLQRAHEVRGAAGARDDRMSFAAFVAWLGREGLAVCSSRGWDGQAWRPLEPTAVLARWLDALRAGGAGETETGG